MTDPAKPVTAGNSALLPSTPSGPKKAAQRAGSAVPHNTDSDKTVAPDSAQKPISAGSTPTERAGQALVPPGIGLMAPGMGAVLGSQVGSSIPITPTVNTLSRSLTPSETAAVAKIIANRANATLADLETLAKILSTPDKISALLNGIAWREQSGWIKVKGPLEVLQSNGDCDEQAGLAVYLLQKNGYEARVVDYFSPGIAHAIVATKEGSTWSIIEYDRRWATGKTDLATALQTVVPDAWRFLVAERSRSATEAPAVPYAVIETKQGLLLKNFFHNDAYAPRSPSMFAPAAPGGNRRPDGKAWGQVSFTSDYSTLSVGAGKWEADVRYFYPSNMQTSNAALGAVRYRLNDNLIISAGGGNLPEGFQYSIGERQRLQYPMSVAFVGIDAQWQLYRHALTKDGKLQFSSEADLHAAIVMGFGPSGSQIGDVAGLSHADGTSRNTLSYKLDEHWSVQASQNVYLPLADMSKFWSRGGTFIDAPASAWAEGGVRYTNGPLMLGVGAYVPERVRTNLLAEKPLAQVEVAYRIGADASVYGMVSAPFDGKSIQAGYLGARWKGLGAFVGTQDLGAGASTKPMFGLSFTKTF